MTVDTEHIPASRINRHPEPGTRFVSLAMTLAGAEFKLRYAGSALSYMWSFCKPLMLFAVLYFVFAHALKFGAGHPHYALTLLLSIVLWTFFAEITSGSVGLLVSRADMLRKLSFNRIVLPISISFSALLTLVLNLLAVGVFMIATGLDPTWRWLELPFLIGELYILALSVGFVLSILFVRFRDVGQLWEVFQQALFYATPIIYPLSAIPSAHVRKLILLNPVGQIVEQARHAIVPGDNVSFFHFESAALGFVPFAIVVVLFALGTWLYHRVGPTLTEHL